MRLQRLNRRKILVEEEEEEEGSTGCDVVPRAQTVQSRASTQQSVSSWINFKNQRHRHISL